MLPFGLASTIFHSAQQAAYDKIVEAKGGIIWHKVGEGKSRIGLLAALKLSPARATILIVCRRIAFQDWRNEIATLQIAVESYELELLPLKHNSRKYPAIILMSWGKWNNPILRQMVHAIKIDTIILDEGWLYKNPRTQVHEHAAEAVAVKNVPAILLSGSIMPAKDITDIYGQAAVINRGRSLATTLSDFRSKYMAGINNGQYFSWQPKRGAYKELIDRISPFTHIHMPETDARKINTQIKKVESLPRQRELIKDLKDYGSLGDHDYNSMTAIVMKCQQISDGWIEWPNKDIDHIPSSKAEMCAAMVEEMLMDNASPVIWCAFRNDLDRLEHELATFKKPIFFLRGGKEFDRAGWDKLQRCKKPAIALGTMSSGSSINAFGQCPYAIYYSEDWKWLSREQSQGRHTRKDSQHEVTHFTFLHTIGSFDSKIHHVVNQAKYTERAFIRKLEVEQWLSS